MSDVTDPSGRRKRRGKAALAAAVDKVDATWNTAGVICSDIERLAGILEVFAIDCADPHRLQTDTEIERQWPQVEYIARQLLRHAGELSRSLDDLESGTFALRRATGLTGEMPT
jgi:hypothetical protein